jgi:hypothetical protein
MSKTKFIGAPVINEESDNSGQNHNCQSCIKQNDHRINFWLGSGRRFWWRIGLCGTLAGEIFRKGFAQKPEGFQALQIQKSLG